MSRLKHLAVISSIHFIMALGCCSAGQVMPAEGVSVAVYPQLVAPDYSYSTDHFAVSADKLPVPVRDYRPFDNSLQGLDRNYHYAHIGLSEEAAVTVEIDAKEPIDAFSISPRAYDIEGTAVGNRLIFMLDRPRYLAIRINRKNMLYILADPIEMDRPSDDGIDPISGKQVLNVASAPYSVDSSGMEVVTVQLQQAIDDAATNDSGGIVYFPAGLYTTHRLILRDNVWIYLEPGAVLMPDPERTNWWMGWEPDHLLTVADTTGNRIYGRGVIYCRNEAFSRQHGPQDRYRLRLRPLKIANVTDFALEGITAAESGEWTFSVEGGKRIVLRNLKVLNEKKLGTNDGIDICGGSDILVEHCFVTTMDDAYCVKGMRGTIRNVRFNNNVADTTKSGFKIGMQGMDEVNGLAVNEHHVIRCYKGLDLCHYYGSADWHDIRFADCRIEEIQGKSGNPVMGGCTPIRLIIDRQTRFGYPKGVGSICDVEFLRIRFDDPGPNAIALRGYDAENAVQDIKFRDLFLENRLLRIGDPALKVYDHVQNITVQGENLPYDNRQEQ